MTEHYRRMWHLVKPGKNGSSVVEGKNWNFLKLTPHRPAPTVCKSVMLTGFGAMAHWDEPRCLTIPELKRLGSFPDEFQSESLRTSGPGSATPCRRSSCVPLSARSA